MRTILFASFLVLTVSAAPACAQVIAGGESERGLRYGPYVPYDGMPYTQRYAYSAGASYLFINGDARALWYLDYLDRADRAEKFGYRPPPDPFCAPPPEAAGRPVRFGLGLGVFRRW